jgi:YHS domain-containing protein
LKVQVERTVRMEDIMKIHEELSFNNRTFWVVLLIVRIAVLSAPGTYAQEAPHQQSNTQAQHTVQTTCPVIVGNPIDKNIYTDYKGKRVYFCCNSCKAKFEKNPEKYLSNLPQFASALESNHNHASHEDGGDLLIPAGLIVPMGIITLSLVALTVALSVFRRVNVRLMMKWHKRMGIAALISGAAHAVLVLIAH